MISIYIPATAVAIFSAYYIFIVAKKPKHYCGNKKMQKFLLHMKSVQRTYWPIPFYFEGRLQTIFGLIRRIPTSHKRPYRREILDLPDGGHLALDYLDSNETVKGKRLTVLFLPGLTSSSQTSYVKSLCLEITNAGANVIVFNNRGIGGVPLKTPRLFCGTSIEDLVHVISHLKSKLPDDKLVGVGTSFGSILYLQYLTRHPDQAKSNLHAVFTISSVFDATAGMESLEPPLNRMLFNNAMGGDLVNRMKKFAPIMKGQPWFKPEKLKKCKTVRDFDIAITVPQFGHESVDAYYKLLTTVHHLQKLTIPVFALNALDDPMQPGTCLPMKQASEENSRLALITTSHGGHLGFLEGLMPFGSKAHFMERVTFDFIRAFQQHGEELKDI